jgi:hypothetical protein
LFICSDVFSLVTTFKQRSQSAGNLFIYPFFGLEEKGIKENKQNTSETLCNNFEIQQISVHVPTHLKPKDDDDFGYYLAGLIDGAGNFSSSPIPNLSFTVRGINKNRNTTPKVKNPISTNKDLNTSQLIISFNKLDASLAYYIKKKIGYGKVYKNKKAILFVLDHQLGLIKVLNLINGKIRFQSRLDQINNLLVQTKLKNFTNITSFKKNKDNNFNNY